jgi:hypothetical protein
MMTRGRKKKNKLGAALKPIEYNTNRTD